MCAASPDGPGGGDRGQVGCGHEAVRRWAVQAQIDAGARTGTTSKESAESTRLKKRTRSFVRVQRDSAGEREPDDQRFSDGVHAGDLSNRQFSAVEPSMGYRFELLPQSWTEKFSSDFEGGSSCMLARSSLTEGQRSTAVALSKTVDLGTIPLKTAL
ncbi:hypothetical protein CH299_11770 [Rhodococcus sp. 14-2686-1-2]|nr:hypothetical protein CH301_11220 [Rhodococcus sp. 15-1189-1-1a]OZF15475.1 hypothetical protein CH299_11770 [Rhodococcus sp. 14-2686-1-2]